MSTSSSKWKAWHNFMPGTTPTLYVTGDVTVPSTGYSASLAPHQPQGINAAIYLLDLNIVAPQPGEIVDRTVTTFEVRYEEKTDTNYEQVTILPENHTVDVEVVS